MQRLLSLPNYQVTYKTHFLLYPCPFNVKHPDKCQSGRTFNSVIGRCFYIHQRATEHSLQNITVRQFPGWSNLCLKLLTLLDCITHPSYCQNPCYLLFVQKEKVTIASVFTQGETGVLQIKRSRNDLKNWKGLWMSHSF